MKKNKPLLSICIPTYNRASIIEAVLKNTILDPDFDEDVELIISDNASSDRTQEVVAPYVNTYSNILYYRNEQNIKDRNFSKVLYYANGEYIKLQNDNLFFKPGGLKFMKDVIKDNLLERNPIFFTLGRIYTNRKNEIVYCKSLDEYIQSVSTYVTYISCFGAWKEQFSQLTNVDKYSELCLSQESWTFQIVDKYKNCIIYDKDIQQGVPFTLGKRSGYNYFKVHLDNYYEIMEPYILKGSIKTETYRQDRLYALRHFSRELYYVFVERPSFFCFDTANSGKYVWRYFKDLPLFYGYLVLYLFLKITPLRIALVCLKKKMKY